jgi:branched-chain amino acid transport system ATP-binding protein
VPGLEAHDITVRFGGAVALDGVSLTVEPATVTGLIGPNGAGKTTLFNVLTGLLPPGSGRVVLNDEDVTRASTHHRARRGLGRTFQRLELFTSLTVRDNVRVAGDIHRSWRRSKGDRPPTVDATLELVGLHHLADREVADLPTGQARLVELARALMIKPSVLLLDEPASGQTERETEAFGGLLGRLSEHEGLAICLVEHDVSLVMGVCSTVHVLDFGVIIASGPAQEVRRDPKVIDAYLGAPESIT